MKRILLALFCLFAYPVMASHIVGGEFEIIHVSGNTYRVNLIMYFDRQNGSPGALDSKVVARIFRMRDNASVRIVRMPKIKEELVYYTQPACSSGEIETTKIIYSTTIEMTPEQYSDSQGYYISWERCCRNYSITNIYSEDPTLGSRYAGQTFYLEFPPVVKNGSPFINSTPRLFPPLSDYACPNKPYYVDFAGVDDDGDSLVYSLVTPFNTHSPDALPPGDSLPRPRPYPPVLWRSVFDEHNFIGGNPDLRISRDGLLTTTPRQQGLFVFAVRCQEFRNGEKIGEVRRDFQMLVVDQCAHAEPPRIVGKKLGDANFTDNTLQVTFTNETDETRCIQVQVSDPDASNILDNFRERITLKAIGLNFKDASSISMPVKSGLLSNGSTQTFNICFDKCPPIKGGGPFQVGIIAYDDACSLPLSDTLKVTVNMQPPVNNKPEFFINSAPVSTVTMTLPAGSSPQTWLIEAVDNDKDNDDPTMFQHLFISPLPEPGLNIFSAGMDFQQRGQNGNTAKAEFSWDPNCTVYDFTKKTEFNIRFLAEDEDACLTSDPDTVDFKLTIQLPTDTDPLITTDLPEELAQNGITKKVFESLEFNVSGTDPDNYLLKLKGQGKGFNLGDYDINFPSVTAINNVTSHFSWNISCEKLNLSQKNEFEFLFIVVDSVNYCQVYKADTLDIKVKVEPPDNQEPVLSVINTNENLTFENNHQTLFAGEQISLALVSNDWDTAPEDNVVIEMVGATGNVEPAGFIFARAEGTGNAQTTFTWDTDCSIFKPGLHENNYTFTFMTKDNRCFASKADTVEVDFVITDRESTDADFIPPNLVTYNGDNKNEFFAMVREDEDTKELKSILPIDNCVGRFLNIKIYNRWGTLVFESFTRDFKWIPDNEAAGIYFYTLQYSDKEYKGSVTVQN
jgi:hypothetical protein